MFAKRQYVDGNFADCWAFTATIDCEKVVFGTVMGGASKMNFIARFLRNGLLAARLRRRHHLMNKKANASAKEAEAAE